MKEIRTHDTITRKMDGKMGSEKGFGLVFAAVFTIVGCLPLVHGGAPHWWAFPVAAVFGALAYVRPALLRPLNYVWYRFGLLLHAVVSPLIMGLVYAVSIVPTGLAMRALGKDLLRKKRDAAAATYWISREPGPAPDSFERQF
jgi:hypothetical protein